MDKQQKFNRKQMVRQFLIRNKEELSSYTKSISVDQTNVTIVSDQQKYLQYLGESIRNGKLVAFPTETVYGLGADATNQSALLDIYKVKKRPLTDPIIAHVLGFQDALPLVNFRNNHEKQLFKKLTQKFWPGPLTIILKANLDKLPLTITAQTGFVGIRAPKNPYARKLIEAAKRPIGAPSANLFSHVSPTSAVHVFNDFYDQQINIVESKRCEYGIESTVIKIEEDGKKIEVLRQGSLSTEKLKTFIGSLDLNSQIQVQVIKKAKPKDNKENMQSPGQLLKHYAPYLPCFSTSYTSIKNATKNIIKASDTLHYKLQQSIIIILQNLQKIEQNLLIQYKKFKYILSIQCKDKEQQSSEILELEQQDQFCSAVQKQKMKYLYYLLRKAENMDAVSIVIVWNQEKSGSIWDKIFRSTQGNQAEMQ